VFQRCFPAVFFSSVNLRVFRLRYTVVLRGFNSVVFNLNPDSPPFSYESLWPDLSRLNQCFCAVLVQKLAGGFLYTHVPDE
jgi:hypothetical protein